MKRFYCLIAACIVISTGCKKEEKVEPDATFTAQPEYGLFVPAAFAATRGEGLQYEWDFGDGSTSNQPSASHTYLKTGSYTITLKVSNADNSKQDTESKVINVFERRITAVTVKQLRFKDPQTGMPWDYSQQDTIGLPDVFINIGKQGGGILAATSVNDNVKPDHLPYTQMLSNSVTLENADYEVSVLEDDGTKGYTMEAWFDDLNKYAQNPITLHKTSGETTTVELNWEYIK